MNSIQFVLLLFKQKINNNFGEEFEKERVFYRFSKAEILFMPSPKRGFQASFIY